MKRSAFWPLVILLALLVPVLLINQVELGAQVWPTPSAHLFPTFTPTPSSTPEVVFGPTRSNPFPTFTPTPTRTATFVIRATQANPFPTFTPTATRTPRPTEPPPTFTPPPAAVAATFSEHYRLQRPVSSGDTNWIARNYPYGGTNGGTLQVHHGVEFVNPIGTPLLAAASGVILYAGSDSGVIFGPVPNYYGNLVVIQHDFTAPDGLPMFTLYGHMDRIDVQAGQTVRASQQIGTVGSSGIALGPHLHFEVRVGDPFDFGATRNPELWIRPFFEYGTLAGRVADAAGNPLYEVTIQIRSNELTRNAFSYGGPSVNPDPLLGENFTMGDLPADYYRVSVNDNGRIRFDEMVYVHPNRTTWVDVTLRP
ncbi:MAG: peptidoglycan DD-metalloendopeptidase family protein [Chloroflexi bacterium]|nr:peptidoglycan DD-metalloendopeptidase family protein [Chloroflexota bacterium]